MHDVYGLWIGSRYHNMVSWRWGCKNSVVFQLHFSNIREQLAVFINLPIGSIGILILLASLPSIKSKNCPDFVIRRLGNSAEHLQRKEVLHLVWRYFDLAGL
jgi:hypothetical protein